MDMTAKEALDIALEGLDYVLENDEPYVLAATWEKWNAARQKLNEPGNNIVILTTEQLATVKEIFQDASYYRLGSEAADFDDPECDPDDKETMDGYRPVMALFDFNDPRTNRSN